MNYIVYDFWILCTRQRFQSEWVYILPQTLSSTFIQLEKNVQVSTLPIIFQSKQYPPPLAASQRARVRFEQGCCKIVV